MQTSFIIMNSNVCDEKIDCSDLAVGRAQANQKAIQKSVYFAKRSASTIRLWQFVRQADPTELALIFYLKIISNT